MNETQAIAAESSAGPWYREVTREQWRTLFAVFLGWLMDAYDFTILTFVLIDIQKSFTVDHALAGLLGTVTLVLRLVGGSLSGTLADKLGRKRPLIASVIWFSIFAALSGFATSYVMLFALRALFGIGMGGQLAAGMPLVMETWPPRLRGWASGIVFGGWYWGVLITALTFQLVYPLLSAHPEDAWRAMFWISVIPALAALWMSARVQESPIWLERQRTLKADHAEPPLSLIRILQRDLIWNTLHASFVVGGLICAYYAITFWYATLLRQASRPTLPYFAAFNIGAIAGNALWGRVSETRVGRRGAVSLGLILAAACIPIYLHGSTATLLIGAALMGLGGTGVNGVMPAYLSERFPTAARAVGVGFTYHAGAAIGSFMPLALGAMQDRGTPLATAMSWAILAACLFTISFVWIVPERRGRDFTAN